MPAEQLAAPNEVVDNLRLNDGTMLHLGDLAVTSLHNEAIGREVVIGDGSFKTDLPEGNETRPESLPSPEASEELMLPPVLYHNAPMDRHQSIAEHGIIPRDDLHNPGGVSGVAQSGEYEFPGRDYLSVKPWKQQTGENVIYAVDTSVLDPSLFQVDEDNYPLGAEYRKHR